MFDFIGLIAAFFTGEQLIEEAAQRPRPANLRFDWDAYYADIESGVPYKTRMKRMNSDYYMTDKPEKIIPYDAVVDVERYEWHKKLYGEAIAESNRRRGEYRYKNKWTQ